MVARAVHPPPTIATTRGQRITSSRAKTRDPPAAPANPSHSAAIVRSPIAPVDRGGDHEHRIERAQAMLPRVRARISAAESPPRTA